MGCDVDESGFTMADVESNIVRCPDQAAAQKMIDGEGVGGASPVFVEGAAAAPCCERFFMQAKRVSRW
jgi:hypothetical protein